jgi:hypothetical protein
MSSIDEKLKKIYMLGTAPYYDSKTETYMEIVTIDKLPPETDGLYKIIRRISTSKLSPFSQNKSICINALCDPEDTNDLLTMRRFGALISYIITHNYKINKAMSNFVTNPEIRKSGNLDDILFFIEKM